MKKITLFLAASGLFIGAFGQNIVQKQQIQQYQNHQLNKIQNLPQNQTISDEDRLAQYPKTASGHIKCIAPDYHESEQQFENWITEKIKEINLSNNQALKATRNIPVVVHVLHNGDAVGSGENISVAQIQSQIDVLNEDYSATNSDFGNTPAVFQSAAGDMDIQFCLALTDPNGNPTTGIDRINVGVASISDTQIETNYGLNNMWDPTKYLNIFVGNITGGLLGKAVFPTGSGLSGMFGGSAPAYDGVMCGATAFGRVGNVGAPYNKGRTATHEIGHWLGLRHIWGDSNCGNDFCNDTPTQQTSNGGCPSFPSITCGNSGDMSMNYMDYTNDACMYMFTNDQKARMDAVLLNSPQRKELLTSNKCMPPAITADFIADITNVNVGGTVNFTDQSVSPNTLNSWTWSFPGGTPNSFVGQTPPAIQYNTPGFYDVTLTVTDNMSASDGETKIDYINVYIAGVCDTLNNPPAGTIVSYTTADGYLAGWNMDYMDKSKAELITGNATYPYVTGGLFGIRSAHDGGNGATVDFNIWDNTGTAGAPGAIVGSVTVPLVSLDFNTSGYENTLVEIMFDQAVNVGSNDFYFGFTMNGFQATDTLGTFSNTDGDSSPGTAWEQWDDNTWSTDAASWGINITQYFAPYLAQNVPTATITTNTTTICAGESVNFDASTSTNATAYDWVFNGGTPSSSTNTAETITYTASGSPRAYLIAYGNCGAIAIDSVDITVNTATTPTFTQAGPYCVGDTPVTLPTTSNNAITGTWNAAISTSSAGTTTYTFTPTGGCATTATMDVVVNANTTPTFTQVGPYCVGDTPATLPTTSNNSVSGTWDAAISTSSAGTTTYTFTPAGGCSSPVIMDVVVNANTTPTFTQVGPYCVGDTPATLPTTSNNSVSGTWDAAISTSSAGTITYTFTPTGGCATTATMDVVVNANVTPTFSQMGPYCVGSTPGTLPTTSNNSVSGTWDAVISTASAGTVTYTFTPSGGCASATTMDVVVSSSITPTFTQVGPYCVGDTPATLPTTSNNSVSGTWDAAISTSNAGTVTYTFTPTGGGCATAATMDVVVNANTTPTFTQVGPYCVGDSPATLPTTSNNSVSGTWNAAISTASAGTITYTFTPTGGGCATAATMDVVVNANTTPTFTQVGPYCVGDSPATLPTTSNNSVSGTWNAAISTASAGTVTYTFTPTGGGCTTTATMDVVVNANTTPTFSLVGPYCIGDTPDVLPTTSINGVTGTWDAAISTSSAGTTTYTFTPAGGCSGAITMDVVVNTCVGINEINTSGVLIYPNPVTETLTIETSNLEVDQVKLINILGETLISSKIISSITKMNVSKFSMGVYFVQLIDNNGQVIRTEKVSIK